MSETSSITWSNELRLAISDVDETIAEVYTPAEPEMIAELTSYLQDGGKLFMVTGGSLTRVKSGITDFIDPSLRRNILIAPCSGSEVWGFVESGEVRTEPFYSIYDETFTPEMKQRWRDLTAQLLQEFELRTHPVEPKTEFWVKVGRDPLDIMYDDRGPQITLGVVNGRDLSDEQLASINHDVPLNQGRHDLRIAINDRAAQLFSESDLPITPRLGGNYSIDFAIEGVSKATSIKSVLSNPSVLQTIGLTMADVQNPEYVEVWGDKYSVQDGGTDRHISEAVPAEVRSIDFRQEDPAELPEGYNIVIWDGKHHLHEGLLEYLQSRHKR